MGARLARWCVRGFKDPDIHEIERSCPTPELSSINITLHILASTTSEGMLTDREKAFTQSYPTVRDEPLYATSPRQKLPGVPEGALIRLDREVYRLVSGMSGWRQSCEMNVFEPCHFSKFAVREEPAVDGDSIAPGDVVKDLSNANCVVNRLKEMEGNSDSCTLISAQYPFQMPHSTAENKSCASNLSKANTRNVSGCIWNSQLDGHPSKTELAPGPEWERK